MVAAVAMDSQNHAQAFLKIPPPPPPLDLVTGEVKTRGVATLAAVAFLKTSQALPIEALVDLLLAQEALVVIEEIEGRLLNSDIYSQ